MHLNLYFIATCVYVLSIVTQKNQAHVLIAGNLADFKNMANKLGSTDLINELVNFALVQNLGKASFPNNSNERKQDSMNNLFNLKESEERMLQHYKTNFDGLIQKVKKRLQGDNEQKSEKDKENNKNISVQNDEFRKSPSKNLYKSPVKTLRKKQQKRKVVPTNNDKKNDEYPDYKLISVKTKKEKPNKNKEENPTDGLLFSEIPMTFKNDSYEDYVTPEREEDIFEKNERERVHGVSKTADVTTTAVPQTIKAKDEQLEDAFQEEKFKAKTEDLNEAEDIEDYIEETDVTKQVAMVPKREIYKISSPNYLAKVPNVVEKYDFNESLPEKDREPEKFKPLPFSYPPSSINQKVKYRLRA